MTFELREKLSRVAGRIRSLRLWSGLSLCWLVWAAIGVVLFRLANSYGWDSAALWTKVAGFALATAIVWGFVVLRTARDQREVARRVEARHPELATLLLAAVEVAQLPRRPGKGPTYLQATVMREALEHGRRIDWTDTVSPWKLRAAKLVQFVALGLLIAVCIGLGGSGRALGGAGSSLFSGFGTGSGDFEIKVDPGNVEIERGTSLLVVAEFPRAVPPDATLEVSSEANSESTDGESLAANTNNVEQVNMVRSLDDPKFVGRVATVTNNLAYHVKF